MYKIIYDNKVIDVVKYPKFIRILNSGCIALTDKQSANGIVGSDDETIYGFKNGLKRISKVVTVCEITEDEFNKLNSLLNSNQDVSADNSALEEAKRIKIKTLSNICKNTIISGFSIKLSDGDTHHFKLTIEDQLNLMLIENQLSSDLNNFIYHSTDNPCKIYLKEDMIKIINAFRRFITYHTTYFNIAKQYINTLTNIDDVVAFEYGTNLINTVDDLIIKQIIKNGGN